MAFVDSQTYRRMVAVAGTSLGYCEPSISDFDAVVAQGGVVGVQVNIKVGKIEKKVKPIATRVVGPNGHNVVAGTGQSMTVYEARQILPEIALNQVNNGLRRDLNGRKARFISSNAVK